MDEKKCQIIVDGGGENDPYNGQGLISGRRGVISPAYQAVETHLTFQVKGDFIMSTENYGRHKFRYVKDNESRGKVKVYVEKGSSSRSKHMYKGKNGSPPHICFKGNSKPSTLSGARKMAHNWANKHS